MPVARNVYMFTILINIRNLKDSLYVLIPLPRYIINRRPLRRMLLIRFRVIMPVDTYIDQESDIHLDLLLTSGFKRSSTVSRV
jgi:hypothetical protein